MINLSRTFARFAACAALAFWRAGAPLHAQELPVVCTAGSCGSGVPGFVTAGIGSATLSGSTLDVVQLTDSATFNWRSFNIGAGGSVTFTQPESSSIALNRIFQTDPTKIFGSLKANGRVFLLNQNGILFGAGAQVNVGGLVASSLDITPEAVRDGIAQASASGRPAFTLFRDESGNPLASGPVAIGRGAEIESQGGLILVFAPEITNEGSMRAPDGQVMLAAGDSIFLQSSTEADLRGLVVQAIAGDGTVTNGTASNSAAERPEDLIGRLIAERGNVSLAALAVNQLGRVTATTSVRQNGSVRLVARSGGTATEPTDNVGTVTFGERSVTEVNLDLEDAATSVDVTAQPKSQIDVDAVRIEALSRSRLAATSGEVTLTAGVAPAGTPITEEPDGSRIYLADDVEIDVAGSSVDLAVERNSLRVELRGNQLRDSPVQRDGPLRGQAVFVDIRRSGVREDGTPWQGTPLADVTGDISTIGRSVGERNLAGGTVVLRSQGDVIVAPSASIDVSGGLIRYQGGYVKTSQLLDADGRVHDISMADPNRVYVGIAKGYTRTHQRWGVTEVFPGFFGETVGRFEPSYVEGKDAGSLSILAPRAIFDGSVQGGVTVGSYQRRPSAPLPSGALYRAYDQVPLSAQLSVGDASGGIAELKNFITPSITFAPGVVLPTLHNADGLAFDPRRDLLPEGVEDVRLRPDLFGPQHVGRVALAANGAVRLPSSSRLELPAGGELVIDAGRVEIDGAVDVPAGSVALTSQPTLVTEVGATGIELGATAHIAARGQWVNDNPDIRFGQDPAPLFIHGGSVDIAAEEGNADLRAGSVIDVSAGAWRDRDGKIAGGRGGSVSVSATPSTEGPTDLRLESELLGYALHEGGALDIAANTICIATVRCGDEERGALWLQPDLFERGGFESYRLTSTLDGLTVQPGTQVLLRQRNLELGGDLLLTPSGASMAGLSHVALLPDIARRPTDLVLATEVFRPTAFNATTFLDAPNLEIGAGAALMSDLRAEITLRSNSRLLVDGIVDAPAGQINLELQADLPTVEFLDSQGIWIGPGARLSAAGASRVIVDDSGLREGDVLDGGTIRLDALRGYIVTQPGSVLDASGTNATLDILGIERGAMKIAPTDVASRGGTIAVAAAEGVILGGALQARAGLGGAALGGTLDVRLDGGSRNDPVAGADSVFPTAARRLIVRPEVDRLVLGAGTGVPAALNGAGMVGADAIAAGGFDSVRLTTRNLFGIVAGIQRVVSNGAVQLDGDVSLEVGRQIILDTPSVVSTGGTARLRAPYVAVGSTDRTTQDVPAELIPGSGALQVDANLVELIGNSALQGLATAAFSSSTDIRFRGIQLSRARDIAGSLRSSADLSLTAEQVYATTLTRFGIDVERDDGLIEVRGGGTPRAVLSAGSRVALAASRIVQGGTIRAPLGEIDLAADEIVLASGSVTSTSASGATIPFGTLQGGFDWAYALFDGQTLVFEGTGEDAMPQQRVTLNGVSIAQESGAVVDISGGGDLFGYEWVPGVQGSRDVLSPAVRPDTFAVIPGFDGAYAPFDQRESFGANLAVGDNVYLAAGSGVPAGTYVLLPPRYALLPGAFLVTPKAGYRDLQLGQTAAQLDGGVVVAGYRAIAGTGFRDSRTSGFAVRPGSLVRREAQYNTALAGEFFVSQAEAAGRPAARVPSDGGILSIVAGADLALNGTLRAEVVAGGRGAGVDLSSDRLRVTGATAGAPATDGFVEIDAASLNRLGAESILLGGTRGGARDEQELTVTADVVEVASGALLEIPELALAARERIAIGAGSVLAASGRAARGADTLHVDGDSAVVRISSGDPVELVRTGVVGSTGELTIADGAVLRSRGSALLDATGRAQLGATYDLVGAALALGAPRITLSEAAVPDSGGLGLSGSALSALGLRELALTSRSSIDVAGNVSLVADTLRIDAGGILGSADSRASLQSDLLSLTNSGSPLTAGASAGLGQLDFLARDFRLGAGKFLVDGFGGTQVAAEQITAEASGALDVRGSLSLRSARVTTESGVRSDITATGLVTIGGPIVPQGGAGPVAPAPGLGGRLQVNGAGVLVSGRLELPAGIVELRSRGGAPGDGVSVTSTGVIDVAGPSVVVDSVNLAAPGGRVSLLAEHGSVDLASGALIDVSAQDGDAGALAISAPSGTLGVAATLRGGGGSGFRSGEFKADAVSLGELDSLNRALNAGEFYGARSVRLRGPGDLVVGVDPTASMTAREVALTADQGAIAVLGRIDASGPAGGSVRLSSRGGVFVGGSVTVAATAAGKDSGRVEVRSTEGPVGLGALSSIDVSSAQARGGELRIRAPRSVVDTLLDAEPLNDQLQLLGVVSGASRTTVEAFAVYDDANGSIDPGEVAANGANPLFAEAAAFMANAAAVRAALGKEDDPTFVLLPGVEVRSSGDLRVATDWNLFGWRFGTTPGVLTLRAGGDLLFDRSLSDGFSALTGAAGFTLTATTDSWSYRLAAGADLASSDPLALSSPWMLAPDKGNIRLAAGTASTNTLPATFRMIRTGTGDIELAAGASLSLGNRASVVYTAGVAGPGAPLSGGIGGLQNLAYPIDGGDISIVAQGDVIGAPTNQMVTDWLWRVGRPATAAFPSATAWTVNFQRFEQNVGALAGGDVTVRAGGNIDQLSVASPTIGRQIGGATPVLSRVEVVGGGDLSVRAGSNIRGGTYYLGRGAGTLEAGDSIAPPTAEGLLPVLALGDGQFSVTARADAGLEAVLNPTLLPQGRTQNPVQTRSLFSTYTDASAVRLTAVGGEAFLSNRNGTGAGSLGQAISSSLALQGLPQSWSVALGIYAPTLKVSALAGDLRIAGPFSLWPAAGADLELLAARNVEVDSAVILMSDTDPAFLPQVTAPHPDYLRLSPVFAGSGALAAPNFNAPSPVHGVVDALDSTPVRVAAQSGSVFFNGSRFLLPKRARFVAAEDLLNVDVVVQNLRDSDVSSLIAGRDITYSIGRGADGAIVPRPESITVRGPGRLELVAGRDVDFKTSGGVTSEGNLVNSALAPAGADVSVTASIGPESRDYGTFIDRYLVPSDSDYTADLLRHVETYTGRTGLAREQALAAFRALDTAEQAALVELILFAELRASGRAAAQSGPTHADFARGFEALTTLYPGSNPDLEAGEENRYSGDLSLFFSRLYTLDGGDVSLSVPGGFVNAGLASPPLAFGVFKDPEELGIVVQSTGTVNAMAFGDFQVNESRVFAADGGNILVWSTRGDIDAGRGAKTAISAPPPTITIDVNGNPIVTFPAALTGSGIQTLATSEGRKPGDVDLFAPRGVVNAGDAGIVAGNLTIAATAVLGADNISVSGVSVGVPVDTGGFAAALTGVSSVASSASSAAEDTVAANREQQQSDTPLAEAALGFLDVFVTGFGDDSAGGAACDPTRESCAAQ